MHGQKPLHDPVSVKHSDALVMKSLSRRTLITDSLAPLPPPHSKYSQNSIIMEWLNYFKYFPQIRQDTAILPV